MHAIKGILGFVLSISLLSCIGAVTKPCTTGGDPARETAWRGTKQCVQRKDPSGNFVNEGKYTEWYPSGARALEGEYDWGRKNGKWTEWDESGKKISEKWYEKGVEVPGRSQ